MDETKARQGARQGQVRSGQVRSGPVRMMMLMRRSRVMIHVIIDIRSMYEATKGHCCAGWRRIWDEFGGFINLNFFFPKKQGFFCFH